MKRTMLAMLMAFFSITAFAQRQDSDMTPEKRAEYQVKTMTEKLSLSEDQQKQIYNLTLARAQKMKELREAQTTDREQMRASMETYNNEVAKLLTVEQQEKYKTMLEDRRGGGGGGGGRGPRGN
jgi:Spy/CpxP family protein refolding chaperone